MGLTVSLFIAASNAILKVIMESISNFLKLNTKTQFLIETGKYISVA